MESDNLAHDDGPLIQALNFGVETRSTDFKESQPFETLQWDLVRHVMAMANLREGGRIIIGVSERDGQPSRDGILAEHEAGYDQDILYNLVNSYARPPVSLTLRIVPFEGKRYVYIAVEPFTETPVVCVKGSRKDGKVRLDPGDIVARSLDCIGTTRIVNAELMADILRIAAEKRAASIVALAQRLGFRLPDADAALFERERLDFGDFA
jgi:predicted HTH transcriptional regulator